MFYVSSFPLSLNLDNNYNFCINSSKLLVIIIIFSIGSLTLRSIDCTNINFDFIIYKFNPLSTTDVFVHHSKTLNSGPKRTRALCVINNIT